MNIVYGCPMLLLVMSSTHHTSALEFLLYCSEMVPSVVSRHKLYIDTYLLLQMIMDRKFEPVIIFSFSRRECEQHALSMSKLDFNTDEEKEVVEQVFNNAMQCLNEEDRSLPAIELMLPLLQRGIAVHHSGLLPVIKELVELLFQEGLVKALFATETVSVLELACLFQLFN